MARKTAPKTAPKTAARKPAAKPAAPVKAGAKGSKPTRSPQPEVVMKATHDEIARKAYEIWESRGCPAGCDGDHWREAETSLNGRQA